MKRYLRQHKGIAAILAFAVFLVFYWLWTLSAPIRGYLAAYTDVHQGRYQVLGYGLPPESRSEYVLCLRERYGIEFRAVAGCVVSEDLVSYVAAYDLVVAEATSRKFGHDVFKECAAEADKAWKMRELHPPAKPASYAPKH
jgi:hypothetical protein